uniref:Uncharacterized protein n=1 Tax=Sinorhizobium meliloti (strain SM11) TaxID=707241 RepID=Q1WLG2_SINMM|nr:hypothetical protein [Sinorhizobium meliloti]
MIRQEVVPRRRIVEHQERAGIRRGNPAQMPGNSGLAVHRIAQRLFLQRHTCEAILTVASKDELRRCAGGFAAVEMRLELLGYSAIGLNTGNFRVEREGAAECRMVAAAMIALAVVLPDQLPVAFLDDRRGERDLGILEVVNLQIGARQLCECLEIRRRIGKTDINEAVEIAQVDGFQAVFRSMEIGTHVVRPDQFTVKLIGPLVVGTDKLRHLPLARLADQRSAVATGIVKGTDFTVTATDDDDLISAYAQRGIAT